MEVQYLLGEGQAGRKIDTRGFEKPCLLPTLAARIKNKTKEKHTKKLNQNNNNKNTQQQQLTRLPVQ